MLKAGIVAGPLYVVVSLIEILLRDDFDPRRSAWSELAIGPYGWIHILNLVVSGLLVVAGAVGWRRVLRGKAWALLAVYGLSLVAAGVFVADPTGTSTPTWHGLLHFAVGGVGFVGLVVACFLVARRMLRTLSLVTGVFFAISFLALVAGAGATWSLFLFTAAVILASAWITTVSLKLDSKVLEAVR
jgi:hypothetical protein